MSIVVIIIILYYNSIDINIASAIILPLSISNITYFDEITKKNSVTIYSNVNKEIFHECSVDKLSKFLKTLDIDTNYIVTIEYISDISIYYLDEINKPRLLLSNPFLINNFSSATLLTKFMNERLELMIDYFYLDDSVLQDSSIILLTYTKIYI